MPGEIFYENGTEWIGVITGVSHKKSSAKRNAVYVTFKDDEKTYWFDKAKVSSCLTETPTAQDQTPVNFALLLVIEEYPSPDSYVVSWFSSSFLSNICLPKALSLTP